MPTDDLEIQRDWDCRPLFFVFPSSRDSRYIIERQREIAVEETARGASGRVLEVAAADAIHSCKLNLRGLESFVLEPSPAMLDLARRRMGEYGAHLTLVRGIAESLPFRDGTFDRVLCESAIDHFAGPDLGIREMTRVLKPDGRLMIGVVNYASLAVRVSRLLYRTGRGTGLVSGDRHLFWDSPVPVEHTFECTYPILVGLCDPYLELERVFGLSLGWGVPGWGRVLKALPRDAATWVLRRLDAVAYRVPRVADYIVSVWRPRPAPRTARGRQPERLEVVPSDPVYQRKIAAEASYWSEHYGNPLSELFRADADFANQWLTGDPGRSWLADLVGRGPFRDAAALGCDEGGYEAAWLRAGGSEQLDVYELSPGVIRRVRASVGDARHVSFIQADLNFARLPSYAYDVIWSSGCLHHIANLEHLLAEVERALRDGGLFAFQDYVGERRRHYAPHRLARINALLREVPVRFRRGAVEAVAPAAVEELSPFCAVRSDDILTLARARFDVVHQRVTGALFPLFLAVDLPALRHEMPELLARLVDAEDEALRDPAIGPCGAYLVLRKRGGQASETTEISSPTSSPSRTQPGS